jgi:hypothetical protein
MKSRRPLPCRQTSGDQCLAVTALQKAVSTIADCSLRDALHIHESLQAAGYTLTCTAAPAREAA